MQLFTQSRTRRLLFLSMGSLVGFVFCLTPNLTQAYSADVTETTATSDSGTWTDVGLQMEVDISGNLATFTAHKINSDGTASSFSGDGELYLNVGSGSSTGAYHGRDQVVAGDTETSFYESFCLYDASQYPKAYYVRFESDDGGYEVVGPITVSYDDPVSTSLAIPITPTVTPTSSSSLEINWSAVSGASEYRLYRSTEADGTYSQVYWGTATTYTDSGSHLSADTTYYYKVVAGDSSSWTEATCSSDGSGVTEASSAPDLKIPLTAGSTLITVQPGGTSMWSGWTDVYHMGAHYYSIDFDDRCSGDYVLAAASGTVSDVTKDNCRQCTFAVDDNGTATTDDDTEYCADSGVDCHMTIDHGNGYSTLYRHMQAGSITLSEGDTVVQGDKLGVIGTTGLSYGTHLHFEILYNGDSSVDSEGLLGMELDGTALSACYAGTSYTSTNTLSDSSLEASRCTLSRADMCTETTNTLNDYEISATDSDGDGLDDETETEFGSDPYTINTDTYVDPRVDDVSCTSADTDTDGDPTCADTDDSDCDGLTDATETAIGTDPYDDDSDDDGLTDGWEVSNGESPTLADGDGDGLLDGEEIELGTMTGYYDSDYDGLWDGAEIDDYNTDPLDTDSDDDSVEDGDEVDAGTDPNDADSDDDGYADGEDSYPLIAAGEIEVILEDSDSAIAMDGDVIVTSTTRDDPTDTWGTLPDFGTVSVYRWDGTLWNLEAELTGNDTRDFGHAVAVADDVIVIGGDTASNYNIGAAYVYRYDGTTWNEEATLTASDAQELSGFSYSLDVADNVIAVSANGYDEGVIDVGAVYLFRYNGSTWSQEEKLTGVYDSAEGVLEKNFTGAAIALSDDLLLVGDYSDGGGVYVYVWNGSTWNEQTIVTASDSTTSDYFGSAVALAGDVAVIGAKGDGNDTATNTGSVYVFRYDGAAWTEEAKLTASDGVYYDFFGYDVAISDELVVVGTRNESVSTYGYDIGKAYTFRWTGSNWEQEEIITPDGETNTFRFGNTVDVSGDLVLVSWFENDSVYVYSRPDSDSDNDGLTNDQETEYGTDASVSDTDGDTVSDYDEVQAGLDPVNSDTDSDGLSDGEDSEPLVALDSDGDGVTDINDACSATVVANSYDTVDETGCALSDLDTDADGLSDYVETVSCAAISETKIFPDDATTNIGFGTAVGLNDDEAVMGAVGYREDGWTLGSAYIFRKTGTSWDQEVQLLASDRNYNRDHSIYVSPYYGSHVAISDDVAVIGAHGDGENGGEYAGAAYAYNYDGSTWNETKLLASDGVAYDYYGYAVAVSDDIAVIGAPYTRHDSGARGSVYVYRWDGTVWNEQSILTPTDGDSQKFFGWSVAVFGDSILVGDRSDSGTGAAYLYEWNGTNWNQTNIFSASDGTAGDDYGGAVSLDEDMVSVGARYTNRTYLYQMIGSTWTETILTGDEADGTDYYGESVEVSANVLLSSAPNDDDNATNAGAIYMNCSDGSNWHEEKLTASDGTTDEQFGSALSLHDRDLLVGVADDADAGSGVGAAYFYELTEPSFTDVADADTDDDTLLDGVDPEPLIPQDTDADGVPDISDTCPTTVIQDTLDVVTAAGCALSDLDTDGDSFTDYVELTEGYDPDNVDYVVTKTADTSDGSCDSDCSLREAITAGNTNTSTPSLTIDFDIPTTDLGCDADGVCTISPTQQLPTLTRGHITVNGDTQDGAIVLSGSAAGTNVRGVYVNSSNNTVQGLVVNQFSRNGIEITRGSENTVTRCYVGTDATGTIDQGNTGVGVYVSTAASSTTITDNVVLGNNTTGIVAGTTTTVADNWIGTNTAYGVSITGSDNVISDNQITDNGNSGIYIATTALTNQITGNTINSNTASGIYSAGTNTTIDGNTIASNTKNGIQVNNGGGNSITGNTIELNRQHGILIVKGTNVIASNVITANGLKGVYLNTANTIGNQISLNSFYSNTGTGITLANGANNSKAAPRITAGSITDTTVTITGTAVAGDTIELFVASSDAEGQTYVDTTTTDSSGNWTLTTTTTTVPSGTKLVATAMDTSNNTSAFSTAYTLP